MGVKGGCEAAIHATGRFVLAMPDDHVIVKLDFKNASNCIHRDVFLGYVASRLPEIYPFCFLAYEESTSLQFGDELILSAEGVQQGDPSGPLLFYLAIQPILRSLSSYLRIGYMDDLTLGGDLESVSADVELIAAEGEAIGLELNHSKCELHLIHASGPAFPSSNITAAEPMRQDSDAAIWRFPRLTVDESCLLGAPLTRGPAMDRILYKRCTELERIVGRLNLISAQDALLILRAAYGSPKILNVLRSAPCVDHPALTRFDTLLRDAISSITNCALDEVAWVQASLPIRVGGLGIRSVVVLASSAFLASAAATSDLQTAILGEDWMTPGLCHIDSFGTLVQRL